MTDLDASNSVDQLRLTVGSLALVVDTSRPKLQVFSKRDRGRLDPQSAEVIMALGGEEPSWLRPVEALICVHHYFPGDQEALIAAAEAIGAKDARRPQIARESESEPVLIALAAFGQKQVATNPLLDERAWTLLRFHRDPEVSRQALDIAHVLPAQLAKFADPETRVRVANNRECPPATLVILSFDERHDVVRMAVARNTSCPPDALNQLSQDENVPVRFSVAANVSASPESLARLLVDRYAHVRVAAVTNPSLPPNAAARRIWIDPTPSVHVALASRADLRPRALSWLERYSRGDDRGWYEEVRRRMRQNPAAPDYLMKRLDYLDRRIAANQRRKAAWFDRLEVVFGIPIAICGLPFAVLFLLAAVGAARTSDLSGSLARGAAAVASGWLTIYLVRRLWRRHPPPTGAYFVPPRRQQAMLLITLIGFAIPVFALAGFAIAQVDAGPFVPIMWLIWSIALVAFKWWDRRRWPRVHPVA